MSHYYCLLEPFIDYYAINDIDITPLAITLIIDMYQ